MRETFDTRKKLFFHTVILTVKIFHTLHDKIALLTNMEQENVSKDFSERFGQDLHETLIRI